MRKMLLLIFYSALLTSCGQYTKVYYGGDEIITHRRYITVVGIAKQDKSGALVDDSVHRYFINGLLDWPDSIYGKKVWARGRQVIYDQRKLMQKTPYRQGIAYQILLEHPKWKLLQ